MITADIREANGELEVRAVLKENSAVVLQLLAAFPEENPSVTTLRAGIDMYNSKISHKFRGGGLLNACVCLLVKKRV